MPDDPDHEQPASPAARNAGEHDEAQRAAEALKAQIAAVRARVKDARKTLAEHARRHGEGRSFKP